MPGTKLSSYLVHIQAYGIETINYYPHFKDEENEAHRSKII